MGYADDPQLVSYPLAYSMLQYMLKARELGAFEGPLGEMAFNKHLLPVVKAMHIVLAGGQVEFTEVQRGNPELINELDEMLERGQADANAINKLSGYYVTIDG